MKYSKPPLSIDDQLSLLQSRGVIVEQEEYARNFLRHVGYYHLSAYCKHYQNHDDVFIEGTTFEQIKDTYTFDRRLILLCFDAIERIEISLRAQMTNELAMSHGVLWYLEEDLYGNQQKLLRSQEDFKEEIDKTKSREGFLKEFYRKYTTENWPPSWIMMEILSFGKTVRCLGNLKRNHQNRISAAYQINNIVLLSWLRGLVDIRNICAHHERLWNREIKPAEQPRVGNFRVPELRGSLFCYLVIIRKLLSKVSPTSTWSKKIYEIIKDNENFHDSLGCPKDWGVYFPEPTS
ncbi:Abi family protein [Patescibacteria group bacterium]|nr:Abi family protein [Patescibacteria group bacterium]MBU1123733.1 Abi family protein [Patescibacteria group bacterium]